MEVLQQHGGGGGAVAFSGSSPISSAPPSPENKPGAAPAPSTNTAYSNDTKPKISLHLNKSPQANGNAPAKAPATTIDGKIRKKPGPKPKAQKNEETATATSRPKAAGGGEKGSEEAPKKKRKPRDPNNPAQSRKKTKPSPPDDTIHVNGGLSSSLQPSNPIGVLGGSKKHTSSLMSMAADKKPTFVHPPPSIDVYPPPPRPVSQHKEIFAPYDPVRSASADISANKSPNKPAEPYKPRPSPTIASMISPPLQTSAYPSQPHTAKPQSSGTSGFSPPAAYAPYVPKSAAASPPRPRTSDFDTRTAAMDIDGAPAPKPTVDLSRSGTPSAKNPSPKPQRVHKDPPMPTGSGLLSSATFGKPSSEPKKPKEYAAVPNQCIVIDVPMGKAGASYVNFLKEVENKYGFDVAHPRLAEHRQRMKDMETAAGAVMAGSGENGVASEDLSSAGSDVDMEDAVANGISGAGNSTDGTTKVKKRKLKADAYDKDDDFIDDAELLWEEQALAVKDGYFVWSGPLITDKDKPTVERADGTTAPARRGRGGGRARGARNGESGRGGRTAGGATGTGGRGSRGGGAPRKSRVTKAEKAKMDSEKAERERLAMTGAGAGKSNSYFGSYA
ncbi:MAG: hypothetical protein M1828_003795 [Chrysothrix sp. TS-e1954]|nr:MAG: hypothetical protein M1828_003795 [Chrysothrix sp. TS-e1954]